MQPKKKTTARKKGFRRSHDALSAKSLATCPNCQEPKLPHHVCPSCGMYDGQEIIKVETK
ncbi:MAG: 50S ribosomal protein L32 [Nitrospinae bacterium]|nr:50S ribosomal protein L32 [Nitrospinota bacterium]